MPGNGTYLIRVIHHLGDGPGTLFGLINPEEEPVVWSPSFRCVVRPGRDEPVYEVGHGLVDE